MAQLAQAGRSIGLVSKKIDILVQKNGFTPDLDSCQQQRDGEGIPPEVSRRRGGAGLEADSGPEGGHGSGEQVPRGAKGPAAPRPRPLCCRERVRKKH